MTCFRKGRRVHSTVHMVYIEAKAIAKIIRTGGERRTGAINAIKRTTTVAAGCDENDRAENFLFDGRYMPPSRGNVIVRVDKKKVRLFSKSTPKLQCTY